MLPVMTGAYPLGSDTEVISFEPNGVGYLRAGAVPAVDPQDPANRRGRLLGVCAVRSAGAGLAGRRVRPGGTPSPRRL